MSSPDDFQRLWQSQETPKTEKNMQTLMNEATRFQSTVKRRNAAEYLAGAFVMMCFSVLALGDGHVVTRAGALLLAIGTGVMIANIRLRGRASDESPPIHVATSDLVAWHRRELRRQLVLLRNVPLWYVGPIVPGVLVFIVGGYLAHPERWPVHLLVLAVCGLTLAAIIMRNRRGAAKLEQQLRDLE
jgi:MFS family permease